MTRVMTRLGVVSILAGVAMSAAPGASWGQQARGRRNRRADTRAPVKTYLSPFDAGPAAAPVSPQVAAAPISWGLMVRADPSAEGAALAVQKRIAEKLTRMQLPPPDVRLQHYQAIHHENFPPITGWHGVITAVGPIDGGHLVKVRVSAELEMAADSHHVFERYAVTNDGVRFLGADLPPLPGPRFILGL